LKEESLKVHRQWIQAGFAVRGTVVRRAVDRNRVRRLMREAYRLHKNALAPRPGFDREVRMVLLFAPSEKEFVIPTYREIEQDVKLFLNKIDSMVSTTTLLDEP